QPGREVFNLSGRALLQDGLPEPGQGSVGVRVAWEWGEDAGDAAALELADVLADLIAASRDAVQARDEVDEAELLEQTRVLAADDDVLRRVVPRFDLLHCGQEFVRDDRPHVRSLVVRDG